LPDHSYLKTARNSGGDTPLGFIDLLLNVGERSTVAIVGEEEDLVEPHAGDDKRAVARQAFGWTGLKVTALDNALKEQLDSLAPIG
jgi:hypothetical protein